MKGVSCSVYAVCRSVCVCVSECLSSDRLIGRLRSASLERRTRSDQSGQTTKTTDQLTRTALHEEEGDGHISMRISVHRFMHACILSLFPLTCLASPQGETVALCARMCGTRIRLDSALRRHAPSERPTQHAQRGLAPDAAPPQPPHPARRARPPTHTTRRRRQVSRTREEGKRHTRERRRGVDARLAHALRAHTVPLDWPTVNARSR